MNVVSVMKYVILLYLTSYKQLSWSMTYLEPLQISISSEASNKDTKTLNFVKLSFSACTPSDFSRVLLISCTV